MTLTIEGVGTIERTGPSSWRLMTEGEHMCGLQGYNPMLGDTCPACEQTKQLWALRARPGAEETQG